MLMICIVSIDAGHMDEALENYNQLLKQCTSCHIRIVFLKRVSEYSGYCYNNNYNNL